MTQMRLTAVEERFRSRGLTLGSVFLLKPHDAIDLVNACRRDNIPVVGAEGFYVEGNTIQPSIEHSTGNFSDDADLFGFTIAFLQRYVGSELWFEVMVDVLRPGSKPV